MVRHAYLEPRIINVTVTDRSDKVLICGSKENVVERAVPFVCEPPIYGKKVSIQLTENASLSLCELEVWGRRGKDLYVHNNFFIETNRYSRTS